MYFIIVVPGKNPFSCANPNLFAIRIREMIVLRHFSLGYVVIYLELQVVE